MHTAEETSRLKSARRKRRLVIADRDKQLIQLDKRRIALRLQKWHLPLVALVHPYQRGWKRFFVLRDDVQRSPQAMFYETLLAKINTVEYHPDKEFKKKKRRKKRYGYEVKPQFLREFSDHSWRINEGKLTEEEKACFSCVERYDACRKIMVIKHVIAEPWRYRLKIAPHMVTHCKMLDVDIERELSYIDDHIKNRDLESRIEGLRHRRRHRWKSWLQKREKYKNRFKNIPRYSPKEAYLDLET